MLEFCCVTKHFSKTNFSLEHITCHLTTGLHLLLGPNGAGKSTLLRVAAGILPPDAGSILYRNYDISADHFRYKYSLGYMPQTLSFYSHMTGMDFLLYLANLKGIFSKRAKQRASYVAELLGIHQSQSKKISSWSIGLRQRLNLAQALLNDPEVLILDEPLSGLAFTESTEIKNLFGYLAKSKIILMSSHLLNDLPVNRLLLLVNGSLKFAGLPSCFIDQANGQVWTAAASKREWERIQCQFPDNTTFFTKEGLSIRIISAEKPDLPNLSPCLPTLEEAYLIWLKQLKQSEAG